MTRNQKKQWQYIREHADDVAAGVVIASAILYFILRIFIFTGNYE